MLLLLQLLGPICYYSRQRRRSACRPCSRSRNDSTRLSALRHRLNPGQLHSRRRRQLQRLHLRQQQQRLRFQRAVAQQQRAANDGVILRFDGGLPRVRQRQLGGSNTRQLTGDRSQQRGRVCGQQVIFSQLREQTCQRDNRAAAAIKRARKSARTGKRSPRMAGT